VGMAYVRQVHGEVRLRRDESVLQTTVHSNTNRKVMRSGRNTQPMHVRYRSGDTGTNLRDRWMDQSYSSFQIR